VAVSAAGHGQLYGQRVDKENHFAHTLPTELPTPISGRPLNSSRFTTVPTTPAAALNKHYE